MLTTLIFLPIILLIIIVAFLYWGDDQKNQRP